MQYFKKQMRNIGQDEYKQHLLFDELMIMKFTLDDILFIDYKISESQLKYLLYHYNLNDDPEVKKMITTLAMIEETMK